MDEGRRHHGLTAALDELRKVIAQAREILDQPTPDTFLGRRTYEPYPAEAGNENS